MDTTKKEENRKPRKKGTEGKKLREIGCQVGPEYPGEGAVISSQPGPAFCVSGVITTAHS